ncbi:MAG: ABC transporter permease [Planctomycetota bacterium]
MIQPTLTIAKNTLVEGLRQPVFFVILLASAIFQYLNTAITGYSMGMTMVPGEVTGDTKLLFDIGLATVFVLGVVLAAFVSTAAVSREIDNKTVLTIVSKPIGRASVVIGKFLGVGVCMLMAAVIMVLHLLYAIHHGVMSTAADDPHMPVIVLGVGSFFLSMTIAGFGNFWYGWSFSQTFVLLLLPLSIVAYIVMLPFDEHWGMADLKEVIRPQVVLACVGVVMAMLVIAGIATAASTRLGQVMTMVVCVGVFALGLLSNHFVGRYAFGNTRLAVIESAEPVNEFRDAGFLSPGQAYRVVLEEPPRENVRVGDPFFYGPSPNGLALVTPAFEPPAIDGANAIDLSDRNFAQGTESGIAIAEVVSDTEFIIRHFGVRPLPIERAPQRNDHFFRAPTEVNVLAFAAWTVIPNLHHYWLVDAVTQANSIPLGHVLMVAVYASFHIGACLCLAVLLFQDRDVG